jgi:hypothetical protein
VQSLQEHAKELRDEGVPRIRLLGRNDAEETDIRVQDRIIMATDGPTGRLRAVQEALYIKVLLQIPQLIRNFVICSDWRAYHAEGASDEF